MTLKWLKMNYFHNLLVRKVKKIKLYNCKTLLSNKWSTVLNNHFIKLIKYYQHIKQCQNNNKKYLLNLTQLHSINNRFLIDLIEVHFQ